MRYKSFSARVRIRRIPYYIRSLINLYGAVTPGYKADFFKMLFISSPNRTIHLKNNLVFKLATPLDILTLKEVVVDNEYQINGVDIGKSDRIIVDVGAGFGDFAIMAAKKFPKASIFAFEPDPRYFKLLCGNLKLNKTDNVFPIKKAVTDLSEMFKLIRSNEIDFLKIDCEGAEFKIFGRKSLHPAGKIKKLVMEYHEDGELTVTLLESFLKRARFTVEIFPQKHVNGIGKLAATLL